jgi:hypothetical protein
MNNDKVHDTKLVIESVDPINRIYYDGYLSEDDVNILQSNVADVNYRIKIEDFGNTLDDDSHRYANIFVKFYQSYDVIEVINKMVGSRVYDITLLYSGHSIKFNECMIYDMRSLYCGDDVLVEVMFTCKPRVGLHIEFEHTRI